MPEEKDKKRITISDLIRSRADGLTISDIMKKTKLARHTVLARLHRLAGEGKVRVRQINMAKLHSWNEEDKDKPKKKDIELVSLKEEHLKKREQKEKKTKEKNQLKKESPGIDMLRIKQEIEDSLRQGSVKKHEAQILEQRAPAEHAVTKLKDKTVEKKQSKIKETNLLTYVPGFDDLFEKGIPRGSSVLVAGGAGSGKTIFCLQTLNHHAEHGEKCFYMSFEESEERLIAHMEDFGWDPRKLIKSGNLKIKRFNPFEITRNVEGMLEKEKGELLIDIDPVILPEDFKPDVIALDSLSAIASAFTEKEESYRIYIEQLFRFFEKIGATSLLITETKQIPDIYSTTGVEEFLADGVIVFYNIKKGDVRESAIEVLKMRGEKHKKKIVAMQITDKGITVYPEQEVFSGN